ncbi:MAG: hypothetical protein KDC90_04185 [Ignavibacteriae bacterium]|nr:hypothetical protein [Ignavibacteriota bacterium]
MNFDHLTYYELINDFFQEYQTEFGRRKFEKVYQKIQTSNKISKLLYVAKQKRAVPNKNDYLYSLNEVPYFIFSKADTLALGALIALERWNKECNQEIVYANEFLLKEIAIKILQDCSKIKLNL